MGLSQRSESNPKSLKKLLYIWKINVIVIRAIFRIVIINKELDITALGRLPELISLLIASWILKLDNVSNKE